MTSVTNLHYTDTLYYSLWVWNNLFNTSKCERNKWFWNENCKYTLVCKLWNNIMLKVLWRGIYLLTSTTARMTRSGDWWTDVDSAVELPEDTVVVRYARSRLRCHGDHRRAPSPPTVPNWVTGNGLIHNVSVWERCFNPTSCRKISNIMVFVKYCVLIFVRTLKKSRPTATPFKRFRMKTFKITVIYLGRWTLKMEYKRI